MAHASFRQLEANQVLCFCGVIQACATGMAMTATPAPSLFFASTDGVHHLAARSSPPERRILVVPALRLREALSK